MMHERATGGRPLRVLNANLFFYPASLGGAAVVAEKLAHGLVGMGHEVTNVYMTGQGSHEDFKVQSSPFGRVIGINNFPQMPGTRFSNPGCASTLNDIIDIVNPDRIILHAVQGMGMLDLLRDRAILERTTIVAHDLYWSCLQGFRSLPDGSHCDRDIGRLDCRGCAWHPGLVDTTYEQMAAALRGCREVIFPSEFLRGRYQRSYGPELGNARVLSNPDRAEMILGDASELPEPPGAALQAEGHYTFGFVGGPGRTKGWDFVKDMLAVADEPDSRIRVVLFDMGRAIGQPWYTVRPSRNAIVADPYHWSHAAHSLGGLDALLMPSHVAESFGLAAREILSLGKVAVIRPSGALAEMQGRRNLYVLDNGDDAATIAARLIAAKEGRPEDAQTARWDSLPAWQPTSMPDYATAIVGPEGPGKAPRSRGPGGSGRIGKLYLNAGQMKAGTTFLQSVLRHHPGIFFSYEKEIHYLSQKHGPIRLLSDRVRLRKAKSIVGEAGKPNEACDRYGHLLRWTANYLEPPTDDGWYQRIFDGRSPDQWAADFSNLTCTIPQEGLRGIDDLADELRVTYCVRDPVDRALSHAKFHLKFAGSNHNLADLDLETLTALVESENIWPQSTSDEHIENLVGAFGEERVRIIRAEEMWRDPGAVTAGICAFLDIAPLEVPPDLEPVNVGPSSELNDEVLALFQDKFSPLRERIDRTLGRYAHLVIA